MARGRVAHVEVLAARPARPPPGGPAGASSARHARHRLGQELGAARRHQEALARRRCTTPGTPPTVVATTGSPALMASMSATGSPSWCEGRTKTSAPAMRRAVSVRVPEEAEAPVGPRPRRRRGPRRPRARRAPPTRSGRGHRRRPRSRAASSEHVVALLAAQVGHRQGQDLAVGHAELGPHARRAPSARCAASWAKRARSHAVDHDPGPALAGPGAGRHGPPSTPRAGPGRAPTVAAVERLGSTTAALFHRLCSV